MFTISPLKSNFSQHLDSNKDPADNNAQEWMGSLPSLLARTKETVSKIASCLKFLHLAGRDREEPNVRCTANCAKSLWGEAPCGSAVYGKVDEMSPAPPPPPAGPPPPTRPPCGEDKEDKEESTTLPARDFALQLP